VGIQVFFQQANIILFFLLSKSKQEDLFKCCAKIFDIDPINHLINRVSSLSSTPTQPTLDYSKNPELSSV
jgi:hypothetical protein